MSRTGTEAKHSTSARPKRETALPQWRFFVAFLATFLCCVQALTAQVAKPAVAPNFGKLPLSFTANQGQADKSVNFLAKGQGYGLYLTANEAVLALSKPAPLASRRNMQEIAHLRMLRPFLSPAQRRRLAKLSAGLLGTDTLRMELKGANAQAQVSGSDELPGTTNYFLGNDPTRWRTRVPTFAKVHYTGVYPGIDLIYYGNQRRLEYDFVVAPHANPGQVELHFSGAQQLKLDRDGNLLVIGDNGEVAFEKPVVYQDEKGQRVPVKGRYALLANHTVGFKVGKYDRSKALVIDPTLSYATYLGGSTEDAGTAIAVDAAGKHLRHRVHRRHGLPRHPRRVPNDEYHGQRGCIRSQAQCSRVCACLLHLSRWNRQHHACRRQRCFRNRCGYSGQRVCMRRNLFQRFSCDYGSIPSAEQWICPQCSKRVRIEAQPRRLGAGIFHLSGRQRFRHCTGTFTMAIPRCE